MRSPKPYQLSPLEEGYLRFPSEIASSRLLRGTGSIFGNARRRRDCRPAMVLGRARQSARTVDRFIAVRERVISPCASKGRSPAAAAMDSFAFASLSSVHRRSRRETPRGDTLGGLEEDFLEGQNRISALLQGAKPQRADAWTDPAIGTAAIGQKSLVFVKATRP
jgi:hypothetical protein